MHLRNVSYHELRITEFATHPGQSWCLFGDNRSGIDRLLELLAGQTERFSADILELPTRPGVLSFRRQQEFFEEELRNDDTDILDKIDPGTLVRELIPDFRDHWPLLQTFAMDRCLDVGYRQLSSGQSRKILLLQALTGGATTLIIQNPYDGLDEQSCIEMDQVLCRLPARGIELLLTINTVSDIPVWCTHLAVMDSGRFIHSGPRNEVFPRLPGPRNGIAPEEKNSDIYSSAPRNPEEPREDLVVLKNGSASYGGRLLFSGLDLTIRTGDHTLIVGPNGCGKSTLLDIIVGDNPCCYTNDLRIFGRKRGSGESIWEIKKDMGIVSPSLHRDHRVPGSALHIILSGLYDTIGLYRKVPPPEVREGRRWLDWLGLPDRADTPFRRLPFAEQRLVLIARALIKRPRLLILDEPTQGLDDRHRQALLDLMGRIAENRLSTILFVSHRRDEHRPFFNRQIRLDDYAANGAAR